MSMHLVGPYMTTLNTRKRKSKVTQGKMNQWIEQYRERCKLNKRYRLPKITFEEFVDEIHGRTKRTREFKPYTPSPDPVMKQIREHREKYPSVGFDNVGPESCAKRESMKYTGTLVKGIATMHKSNAVPVIDRQQMEEISRMRRG